MASELGMLAASEAVKGAIGLGYGAAGQAISNGTQYWFNEKVAKNADTRYRQMYSDLFSPEAMIRQYKEAGISPSILYGGTPQQGGSAQGMQGNGVNGGVPMYGASGTEWASIKLMNAEAAKAQAEADRIAGKGTMGEADYNKIMADTEKALADAGHAKAAKALTEWQTAFNKANEETMTDTLREQLAKLEEETNNLIKQGEILDLDIKKYKATYETQVKMYTAELANKYADTAEKQAKLSEIATTIIMQQFEMALSKANFEVENKVKAAEVMKILNSINIDKGQLELQMKNLGFQMKKQTQDKWMQGLEIIGRIAGSVLLFYGMKGVNVKAVAPITYGTPDPVYQSGGI